MYCLRTRRTLYIPMTNRSSWAELEADTVALIEQLAGVQERRVSLRHAAINIKRHNQRAC